MTLHACTDSEAHVALLVGSLLNDVAKVDQEVSHADTLQALAITTALRAAIADAAAKTGADFSRRFLTSTFFQQARFCDLLRRKAVKHHCRTPSERPSGICAELHQQISNPSNRTNEE